MFHCPSNTPLWHKNSFDMKTFKFLRSLICLKAEPLKRTWLLNGYSICIAESLHSAPETITTLLPGYTPIQIEKFFFFFFLEKELNCHKFPPWEQISFFLLEWRRPYHTQTNISHLLFFLLTWTIFKVFIEFVIILLLLFWCFGHEACEILAHQPGIEPVPYA